MKKFIVLCAAALTLGASAAYAGIDLSWDGCNPGVAAQDKALSCDGSGFYEMYGTVNPTQPVNQFLSMQGSADLQSQVGPVPDFWSFELGGANEGVLSYTDARGSSTLSCNGGVQMWGTTGGSGTDVSQWNVRQGNRVLFQFADARTTPLVAPLAVGTLYYLFTIIIDESVAGNFTGCGDPVALVLNQVDLLPATGQPISESAPGVRGNCTTANGASSATCAATPVKNQTWGKVKSLYR